MYRKDDFLSSFLNPAWPERIFNNIITMEVTDSIPQRMTSGTQDIKSGLNHNLFKDPINVN